jgi:protein-S-isoprenylcysteine O-methyltransferase Ste14
MDAIIIIRAASLYFPVTLAFVITLIRPRRARLFASALLGFVWCLPTLIALQLLNLQSGWWQFHAVGGLFRGMPIEMYLGWAVLWGVVPAVSLPEASISWRVVVFLLLDLSLMPWCAPVVTLNREWLFGEVVAATFVLIPAQLLARWTLLGVEVKGRALLQVITAGGVFLFLLPEVIFASRPGSGWTALWAQPAWVRSFEFQLVFLLAIPGISAVQEFAERGGGTPIPYDPPQRLVTSGFYRYAANPMQVSCAVVLACWGVVLRNGLVAAAGVMTFLYSLGLAAWDEREDMTGRFGASWEEYRQNVKPWRVRWRPWNANKAPAARLYIAETCGPCLEVRRWFNRRGVTGLEIIAAEEHPSRDLERMTYDPMDGSYEAEGARAFARGLEHINFAWAFAGALLRLPGIAHFAQVVMDASGAGPRTIPRRCETGASDVMVRAVPSERVEHR